MSDETVNPRRKRRRVRRSLLAVGLATGLAGACFEIRAAADGTVIGLADGGFTTWTADLLSNAKERLLISGLGIERLCGLPPPATSAGPLPRRTGADRRAGQQRARHPAAPAARAGPGEGTQFPLSPTDSN